MVLGVANSGARAASSQPKVSLSHSALGAPDTPTSRLGNPPKADELRSGGDHYVYLGDKCEAILLPSLYPDEFALRRAKRAFEKANPSRRVVVIASRPSRG